MVASHIGLMMDCAQICQISSDFRMRNSSPHSRTCAVCAEICEVCAESWAKFQGDEMMQECADACRA